MINAAVLTDRLTKALLSLVPDEVSMGLSELGISILGVDVGFGDYEGIML